MKDIATVSEVYQLQERIKALEKENNELRTAIIDPNRALDIQVVESNEIIIADIELKKLKEIAFSRALNLEESKRYQIYVNCKIALTKKDSEKDNSRDVTPKDVKDLLAIAKNSNG